jgi:hypothetical protein
MVEVCNLYMNLGVILDYFQNSRGEYFFLENRIDPITIINL